MIKKKTPLITFGSYIRSLRIESGIGQRELAKKIDISPSYLNDLEKNKRNAPKVELINKLSILLKADLELLYNLAGDSIQSVPPDLSEYIENNPKI
ncbi:helix-turn-helix transcriptional regulator, partial [Pelagibacteraceae bacterium]|nr:helix-turn-helix transcriptional regulator [Pelagibacteraceae bacterium]